MAQKEDLPVCALNLLERQQVIRLLCHVCKHSNSNLKLKLLEAHVLCGEGICLFIEIDLLTFCPLGILV